MRLPLVPRSELSLAHSEVEEWRRRAESKSMLGEDDTRAPVSRHVRRRSRSRRLGQLLTVFVVTAAVALGALLLPARTQSASPDYSGCIGKARYERPIEGNQYQELVNALYACGVYRLP
jgi:ferric-dicitrate binding protein FerR (iron transport regulator)